MKKFTHGLKFIVFARSISSVVFLMLMLPGTSALANPAVDQEINKIMIDVDFRDITLDEALSRVKVLSGLGLIYNSSVGLNRKVTVKAEHISVAEVLTLLLKGTGFTFRQDGQNVLLVKMAHKKKPGTVSGQVIDGESGEPLIGVTVAVKNGTAFSVTDVEGRYSVHLEPGNYDLEFRLLGYQVKVVQGVIVEDGGLTSLDIAMQADVAQLGEVVVTAEYDKASVEGLLVKQKNSAGVTDGISQDQIRLSPDNNAAQVLKRVSGVIVQNDKFVTIRGVSDRYNNVLINGASLPSTEPNRRNFSFDIVPSRLVDNLVINKTATPDLPGEFVGGLVQINTTDVPFRSFLNLSVGTGYNTESAGTDFLNFKRDKKAQLGIVDNNRKWFGDGRVFDQQEYIKYSSSNDVDAMRRIGSQIPDRWQVYRYGYKPMQNYQLLGGSSKLLKNNNSIGAVGAVTYRNEMLHEEAETRSLQNYDYIANKYRYTTSIGGLFNTAFKSERHKIAWKNLYNYRYDDQFDDRYGNNQVTGIERRTGQTTLTNNMLFTRLEGEHDLLGAHARLDWYGDYIAFKREQPDGHYLVGVDKQPGSHIYTYDFNSRFLPFGGVYASVLDEKKRNAGINLNVPVTVAKARQSFKAGYSYSKRTADFDATGLRILNGNSIEYTQQRSGLPYYEIVTPEAVSSGKLIYSPTYTRASSTGDQYTAEQLLRSAYVMADLKLLRQLRLVGGIRQENNQMTVTTVFYNALTGYTVFKDSTYQEKDWLPSVNLIHNVTEKFNIRAAFSKTLARPDFVERSPYVYYDFFEQLEVTGQQSLAVSRIKNYDLRFEYYPSGNEIISASLFYKDIDKPVERFYNLGNPSNGVEYRNLYSATAKGFEVDVRKSLAFVAPHRNWLQQLYVNANFTYLKGGIKHVVTQVPSTQNPGVLIDTFLVAETARPIQGLSPYIINGGVSYQSKTFGLNIIYNRFGRRIVNGGTDPRLVQYENPRDVIDLQLTLHAFKQKAEIRFNISDLLNQYTIIYCNNINLNPDGSIFPGIGANDDPKGDSFNERLDLVIYKTKKGSSFNMSITYKL